MVYIPVGRMARWAKELKQGYTSDSFSRSHDFVGYNGETRAESYARGLQGEPWCASCGKHRRAHTT
jgi:hypothetical protein